MEEISLVQYNADRRHYVSVSTRNYSRRKTRVEKLKNDLAGKSLLEGVLLYISRNHPFNSFKGPLIFISFVIMIYQRPYTRWFVIICRLQYEGVLFVAANRGSLDETAMVDEEKGMSLVAMFLLQPCYFKLLLFPPLFWSNIF